jgi:hypothetical protein
VSEYLTPEEDTIGGQTDPDEDADSGDQPAGDEEES